MLDSKKQCPFCHHQDTVRRFADWEKDGRRGLVGQTAGGYALLLCPECNHEIRWDILENSFLKTE